MKSFIARFVANQSGAISFEDGLTILCLTIGFAAALALLNSTVVQLYTGIFGLLTESR
jgi:Flp pilus assembly pilin Flp